MKATDLTIFVTSVKGEEIQIEKACTLKQAVTLAKKEARKMINNGGMWVTINIQARASYGVETLAHIEAEKVGRRVAFSDEKPAETPAETYAVCWGDEYKEEDGENNVIAETTNESEAREIALNESRENGCAMSVVRMSDKTAVLVISDSIGLAPEAAAAYDALCSSFVDTYQPEPTNPDNTPSTMNANEIPANVMFAEYTGETDFRNIVDTINVNGTEYGIRVRRMHGLNPANDGEYYVIYMPDEAKAEQLEAALKAAGHKATPDEYGVIVCTWEAFMAGVEMLNQEQPAPEFSELSHAAQCLDIYLHNTAEIYDRYTVPAIKRVAQAYKAGEHVSDNAEQLTKDIQEIAPAISAAARLVRKYDHLTPTAQDIEQVTRNYAAYIVDCAKYEIETA